VIIKPSQLQGIQVTRFVTCAKPMVKKGTQVPHGSRIDTPHSKVTAMPCDEKQLLSSMITCAKVGALPSAKGENVCLGPSKLKKLIGRGSSSVSVYTCLMPVFLMAAMHAGLLGVADAASLRACSCDSRRLHMALSRRFVSSAVSHSRYQLGNGTCQGSLMIFVKSGHGTEAVHPRKQP